MTEQAVIQALQNYQDPYLQTNLYDTGCIKQMRVKSSTVKLSVQLPYPADKAGPEVIQDLEGHLKTYLPQAKIKLDWTWKVQAKTVQQGMKGFDRITNVIPIASAKGGVGKSTTAANLALALKNEGAKVGILDADIYGPNQPSILGLTEQNPYTTKDKKLVPLSAYGVETMSIGYLFGYREPVVWRGPMLTKALEQLLNDTQWGDLDYLIVDLPPGTGDIQMTLSQKIPVSGAVIVTTPQDLALVDTEKSVKMFQKLGVPMLGCVANMSVYHCPDCGHEDHIFGRLNNETFQKHLGLPLLGELPLSMDVRQASDDGVPVVMANPQPEMAKWYEKTALTTAAELGKRKKDLNRKLPNVMLQSE